MSHDTYTPDLQVRGFAAREWWTFGAYMASVVSLTLVAVLADSETLRSTFEAVTNNGSVGVAVLAGVMVVVSVLMAMVSLLLTLLVFIVLGDRLSRTFARRTALARYVRTLWVPALRNAMLAVFVVATGSPERLSALRWVDPFLLLQGAFLYVLIRDGVGLTRRSAAVLAAVTCLGGVLLNAATA